LSTRFLPKFLELRKVTFGANQNKCSFEIKSQFQTLGRSHSSALLLSLSSGPSPTCQRPTLSAGPSCQSPLSVSVPPVSSLLTLCHTPHTPSCRRSHQGYLATQETHLSFQRQGQYHPHRPLFLGNISYAHGDLVHMCTNRILALDSSSNFLWQKGFFCKITWYTNGELQKGLFKELSQEIR
jgi:hypothetical protein